MKNKLKLKRLDTELIASVRIYFLISIGCLIFFRNFAQALAGGSLIMFLYFQTHKYMRPASYIALVMFLYLQFVLRNVFNVFEFTPYYLNLFYLAPIPFILWGFYIYEKANRNFYQNKKNDSEVEIKPPHWPFRLPNIDINPFHSKR